MITFNAPRPSSVEVVTFDCYGTLIDWETGIWNAFREVAAEDGVRLERQGVIEAYHAVEAMVEEGVFRPYGEVLTESARRVAAELGWAIDRERAAFLRRSLARWPPFPDTNAALELLAPSRRLGILSNVDEDLLEATRRHLAVEFDFWITADRVESYKPDLAHFEAARPFVGDPAGWLHVAQSLHHDVEPAVTIGLPVAWINRKAQVRTEDDPLPSREFPDLISLSEWLTGNGQDRS